MSQNSAHLDFRFIPFLFFSWEIIKPFPTLKDEKSEGKMFNDVWTKTLTTTTVIQKRVEEAKTQQGLGFHMTVLTMANVWKFVHDLPELSLACLPGKEQKKRNKCRHHHHYPHHRRACGSGFYFTRKRSCRHPSPSAQPGAQICSLIC